MLKNHRPQIAIGAFALLLLQACSSISTTPLPNVTLNNISSATSLLTKCEGDSPLCQEARVSTQEKTWDVLNGLRNRKFDTIKIKVEKITGDPSEGWKISGKAVWDQDSDNAITGYGVALLSGLAAGVIDGSVASGLAVGGSIAAETAKIKSGVCLTTYDPTYKGNSKIDVVIQTAILLEDVDEGSIAEVSADSGELQKFGNYGIFDKQLGSVSFAYGDDQFPGVTLVFKTAYVSKLNGDVKEYKTCRKT